MNPFILILSLSYEEPRRVCQVTFLLCYTTATNTQAAHVPITHTHAKERERKKREGIATRHRRALVDTGQLPMMHCKCNVSSAASSHQLRAISGLAWSAQSNRIWCGTPPLSPLPVDLLPLFFRILALWAKRGISHVCKVLFTSQRVTRGRGGGGWVGGRGEKKKKQKKKKKKKECFSFPFHIRCSSSKAGGWKQTAAQNRQAASRRAPAPVTPSRYVEMFFSPAKQLGL